MGKRKSEQKTKKQSVEKPRSRKSREIQCTVFVTVDGTEYDITDKKPDELPDVVKKALIPAQEFYAKLVVDSAWRNFYNNLPKELKDMYDNGSLLDKRKIQSVWAETFLSKMDNQADDTEK
jgi:hypothetical protein